MVTSNIRSSVKQLNVELWRRAIGEEAYPLTHMMESVLYMGFRHRAKDLEKILRSEMIHPEDFGVKVKTVGTNSPPYNFVRRSLIEKAIEELKLPFSFNDLLLHARGY